MWWTSTALWFSLGQVGVVDIYSTMVFPRAGWCGGHTSLWFSLGQVGVVDIYSTMVFPRAGWCGGHLQHYGFP